MNRRLPYLQFPVTGCIWTLKIFLVYSSFLYSPLHAGRYEDLKQKAARGPHLEITAATFFGGSGNDEIVGGAELADGRILAIGNTSSSELDDLDQTKGFIMAYPKDLSRELGAIQFQPGEGRFTTGILDRSKTKLFLAGRAGPKTDALQRRALRKQQIKINRNYFAMALDVTNGNILWITELDLKQPPHRSKLDNNGDLLITTIRKGEAELIQISALEGKSSEVLRMARSNRGGFLAVDPSSGALLYGSDRNTHTGREPWRQPYFFKLAPSVVGKPKPDSSDYLMDRWQWKPNIEIRGDAKDGAKKLESDSSIVEAAYTDKGDLFVAAWSDGGNSVMSKQPQSLDESWEASALGISTWGMRGANGISWLLHLDPELKRVKNGTQWVTFIPEGFENGPGNWPNALHINELTTLPNDSLVLNGRAWTGLVPTPNAFWIRPESYPGKYNGHFVSVLSQDLNHIHFSSYLPGYESSIVLPLSDGLLIMGATKENDGFEGVMATPPVSRLAAQKTYGGGGTDGHIIRLALP